MFIEATLTIAKMWKQSKCPTTDGWIKKKKKKRIKFCHLQQYG